MSDPSRKVSAPHDPKGRLISIFVGAVLLPSLALSYVSLEFVPQLAKGRKASQFKDAERNLFYIEKELAQSAQAKALEAARAVGIERLLDGRENVIEEALAEAGYDPHAFEALHLEGASPRKRIVAKARFGETPREAWSALEPSAEQQTRAEESVPWPGHDGATAGVLRYRYAEKHVHERLVREYFEKEFANPEQGLVIRVTDQDGRVLYETRPTPGGKFEVYRLMESPSFRGLKLSLRYRDLSIEQDVRRWEMGPSPSSGSSTSCWARVFPRVQQREARDAPLPAEVRLRGQREPRAEDPSCAHPSFRRDARARSGGERRQGAPVLSGDQQGEPAAHPAHQQHPRFLADRGGRKEYRFAPTDVSRMVTDVVEAYRFQIEQQGFTLEVALEEGLPLVEADQEALTRPC
jgi:hypothetical protein